jgi:hypothetical protein
MEERNLMAEPQEMQFAWLKRATRKQDDTGMQLKRSLETSMAEKQKGKVGAFVKIPLDEKTHSYGRILEDAVFAFYDAKTDKDLSLMEAQSKPILFKVPVMDRAVTSGRWEIVGIAPLEDSLKALPRFFKQDPINNKLSTYYRGEERPATAEECEGLEKAAVWDAEHVEDRLTDHYLGRPNKWVASMKIKA